MLASRRRKCGGGDSGAEMRALTYRSRRDCLLIAFNDRICPSEHVIQEDASGHHENLGLGTSVRQSRQLRRVKRCCEQGGQLAMWCACIYTS